MNVRMRRQMSTRLSILVLCGSVSCVAQSPAPTLTSKPSTVLQEETVVRNAYSRLDYLMRLTVYTEAAKHGIAGQVVDPIEVASKVQDAVPTYSLTSFKAGPLSEIANEKWGDVVSAPLNTDSLTHVTLGHQAYKDPDLAGVNWQSAEANSVKADQVPEDVRNKILSMTVQQVLSFGGRYFVTPDVVYDRYATFLVTSTYKGRTTGPYKALFLFGKNSSGEEVAAPQDLYSDTTALQAAAFGLPYPSGILHTHLREVPILADWLNATQIPAQTCSTTKLDLCCSNSKCGISQVNLQHELSIPLAPNL